MKVEEIVDKFVKSPSQLTTGMPSLAKRWDVNLDDLYLAKGIANDIVKNKEKFGTEYNPKDVAFNLENINTIKHNPFTGEIELGVEPKKDLGKLKSKWGSEGNWKYSYDYSQKSCENIDFEGILSKVFSSQDKVSEIVYNEPILTSQNQNQNQSKYCENIYISDSHVGMDVSYATYSNFFDKHVYKDRMNTVFMDTAVRVSQYGKFNTINVDYLGDIFDGQDAFTVKRTHRLPQNMSNAECFEVALYTNKVFLERLFTSNFSDNYSVHFVRESNHGGDMDLYLFQSLKLWINTKFPNVNVVIARKVIDHYIIGNHAFIYGHGKDNTDMKFGWPLTINDKLENYIDQYIKEYKLYEYFVHTVSGDLHQDATTNAKLFRYRKVPALAGSSKWVMSNFGLTEPGTGIDIYRLDKKNVIQDVILF